MVFDFEGEHHPGGRHAQDAARGPRSLGEADQDEGRGCDEAADTITLANVGAEAAGELGTITLSGLSFTVVGVMPPSFELLMLPASLWLPASEMVWMMPVTQATSIAGTERRRSSPRNPGFAAPGLRIR